jgi:hypothetical protein
LQNMPLIINRYINNYLQLKYWKDFSLYLSVNLIDTFTFHLKSPSHELQHSYPVS